ncbi:nucleotide sugar dehydrogenase [Enterococcus durans]|uniref:nucleotide sugar dehydrogenase n=1 Tax=Enterococcus durans TaxID=53345 RepID=UPI001884074F|nr:nucleotide sugar dehydrogenase [Enterococcus durans]MBE9886272.1 nucleotide sugar dehydrogenase [Enterococcus durans]
MALLNLLENSKTKISVIGLGYVGLPLAVAFAEKGYKVIGFDLNVEKINDYKNGIDSTGEIGKLRLNNENLIYTSDPRRISEARFHVVAVPTPINGDKTPDLLPVISASEIVGKQLKKGSIVVYESTVYPGVTEDICLPILEKNSNLKYGEEFSIGYSPERINPGDKIHRLETITKVVSASDKATLETVAAIYGSIIKAGIYKAPSIRVAEASKVIENSQRDINIAFMNELSMVFDLMNIDTSEVLKAANTKWNFLDFKPGLVGGHCIGVDPYYFTYRAEELGYHSQIILSGRKINNDMPRFVVNKLIKEMIKNDIKIKNSKVAILGLTFKEDCPDFRNSKNIELIEILEEYDINIDVFDPYIEEIDNSYIYKLSRVNLEELNEYDAVILAVPHKEILLNLDIECIDTIFFDLKGAIDKKSKSSKFLTL